MEASDAQNHHEAYDTAGLQTLIARWLGIDRVPRVLRVITDTSDFFGVDYDDVVLLGGRPYLIRNNEREGRFGIDDEQKFWVKRSVDLTDGSTRIIKLVFHERFESKVGGLVFQCVRSPRKEARILDLVRGNPRFMQGFSLSDSAGNTVRVLNYIKGKKFSDYVLELGRTHEEYFYDHFPAVLDEFTSLVEAIRFLHRNGEKHGDIRRDHAIRDAATGLCRWIDFDFDYLHKESMYGYDLFGLGNILVYLVGRGDVTTQELSVSNPAALQRLTEGDVNIIFANRVVNLTKVYPYIPDALNAVLLHFSTGAEVFYDTTDQLLDDLREVRSLLTKNRRGIS
jgi:hypothetical protein